MLTLADVAVVGGLYWAWSARPVGGRRRPGAGSAARRSRAMVLRRAGWLAAVMAAGVVAPPMVLAIPVLWYGHDVWARRRAARRVAQAVVVGLADVADLFVTCVTGGLTVGLAVDAVARRAPAPYADALAAVTRRTEQGVRLADSLEQLPDALGDPVRPLVRCLVGSERYGTPVGESLSDVASDARRDRRRQAEVAARRLPVLLLFPLVLCILPAFAVLTLAPLVGGAVSSLR